MPVKRRLSKAREHVVDAEAVSLFEHGLALHGHRHLSDDYMRSYSAAASALDRRLGIKLWATPILDTVGLEEPPAWMDGEFEISLWRESKQIERQLQAALAARQFASR